jgi:hypothetical protein
LQQKFAVIQRNHLVLAAQLNKKTEEVARLMGANESLLAEVKDLKQRWRTMVALLRRPRGPQSLSVLISETNENGSFDDYMRCIDALLLPDYRSVV